MLVRATSSVRRSPMWLATLGVSVGALLVAVATPADSTPSRQWTGRPPVHHARAGLSVEQTGNAIIAIGGFDSNDVLGTTEVRQRDGLGVWHDVATMPTARADFASAVVAGVVYAAGGYDAVDQTNVVERYNPKLNRWTTSRPLPQPRGGDAGASLDGLFYVAGGYITQGVGDDQLSASVLAYDPRRDTWRNVAPMHTARERLRLVAAGRFLYAIGGVDANGTSLATVERYNPRTNDWATIAPLDASRAFPGVVATSIAGHPVVVVVGGADFDAFGNDVGQRRTTEVLNIATGRWHTLEVLLAYGRAGLSCATAADGAVLAISGGTPVNNQNVLVSDVDALRLEPRDLFGDPVH
jgi:N-acetylneuraminic acid mutarotase